VAPRIKAIRGLFMDVFLSRCVQHDPGVIQ
jgi:hypothetical protein